MTKRQVSQSPHTEDPILLAREAAIYLAMHPKTLARLTRARAIACIRLAQGGPVRYRRSALDAYLAAHECPARPVADAPS